ncbi:2OG-Fe(II) oxygenase [Fusarium heterosporum]|uniref:2OG-Fe(II) oxygenase n=1 Tax=Fusarium heterosporum TaxID=42747 RepID=A0A8H5TFL6_FUSHE|nr:2OG-Fe(II) oxygenase [Fusarium heterosporum]
MARINEVIDISDDDDNVVPPIQEHIWKQTLFNALNAIKADRKLVSFNRYQEFVNPGLKFRGHQVVPLPLTDHYVEVIKGLCGDAHDTTRNVWELDHTQFELINPAWSSCRDRIAEHITKGLRIDNALLRLQKMTLQGPGPLTENTGSSGQSNSTIGYLTICLPSRHGGGDIHLSFSGATTHISTAASSMFDLSAFAWFSDTDYQPKELLSGYRLTITYVLYKNVPTPLSGVGAELVAEILRKWPWKYSDSNKILYKLDDEQGTTSLSLKDMKDRDQAVCQVLSKACHGAGLYMLFAEITCQVEDDCGREDLTSSIDELYTLDGQHLTSSKEFDAEEEVLGFDAEDLSEREADSDEDEGASNEYLMEEHTTRRRWHDTAALLIPKVGLLDLVRLGDYKAPWQATQNRCVQQTLHIGVGRVVAMAVQDLEQSPRDPKATKVAANIINTLGGTMDVTQRLYISPIINWSLELEDLSLYKLAFQKAVIPVVGILTGFLARRYIGSEDSIDWKKWLDYVPDKPIGYFRGIYRDLSRVILPISKPVSMSFEAWAQVTMDEKIDSERNWEFGHLDIILDWIRERFQDHEWITNRLLRKVASGRHSQSHGALLVHLLHRIYEFRHESQFARAKEMFQVIIDNSGGELNFPPNTLEPTGAAWSIDVPKHDLVCGPFVRLMTECYLIGAVEGASQIIAETFSNMVKAKPKWLLVRDPFGVIHCLITPIIQFFAEGRSPTIPAVIEVLELLVRKIIRIDLAKQTQRPGSWVFRERGCGFCNDCAELNHFLTSSEMTSWTFAGSTSRRLHVEHAIGMDGSLSVMTIPHSSHPILQVVKFKPQDQVSLQSWSFNHGGLTQVLQPLQGEFMKGVLGEQRYREIILLEGVTPFAQPPTGTAVGFRRSVAEDAVQPDKRRCTEIPVPSPGVEIKTEPIVKAERLDNQELEDVH